MKYLLLIIFLFIGNVGFALDSIPPLKMPENHELISISTNQNIWFRGKRIDQQQLIAAVTYLKTTENLEVVVVAADSEINRESEFYKQLISQLSERVRTINWEDM